MFMQVRSLCLQEDYFSTQMSIRKASLSNQLWCSDANDLEVGLLQSSHTVTVTYTSGDTLPDFLISKLFTDACIFTVRCHRLWTQLIVLWLSIGLHLL